MSCMNRTNTLCFGIERGWKSRMRKEKIKRNVRILTAFVLCLCAVFSGSACQKRAVGSDDGGTVRIAVSSDTGTLDPSGEIALTYLAYAPCAMDELVTFDRQGEIVYRGARSYEISEDATVWTFHLQENAKWSDGTAVTAQDYIHTIKRSLDPINASNYAVYLFCLKNAEKIYKGEASIGELGVAAPDEYTLVFTLESPCVYFLDLLRLPVYMPSPTAYTDEKGWDRQPDRHPSNGPYCLEEYVSGQYMTLKKNPYYSGGGDGHGTENADRLIYYFFDDQQTMANAFSSGEVDVATGLSGAAAQEYEGKPELMSTELIASRYMYPNLSVAPLDDVRVRKALALAIDRDSLSALAGADTEPSRTFIAGHMVDKTTGRYYAEELSDTFREDVEEAKRLLAEAGYPDGAGFPSLTYSYPALETDSAIAQVLQEQWKANLNIDIRLDAKELQTHYSQRRSGKFDLCRMNWTADFSDPYTYLSLLLSDSTYNCSGIADEAYDRMVEESGKTSDAEERGALIEKAHRRAVGEQFYVIPLLSMKGIHLVADRVEGVDVLPSSGALDLRHVKIAEQAGEKTGAQQ